MMILHTYGQIWSILYLLMGYSSYLVWERVGLHSKELGIYTAQLALNILWQVR